MSSSQPTVDTQLAAAGDADALQRLIVHYHTPLLAAVTAAIAANLRTRIDPADVLQEAYTAAFKALRGGANEQNRDRQRADGEQGSGIGDQGAGSGEQGSGFGVQGSGEQQPPDRSHVPTFPRSHAGTDRTHVPTFPRSHADRSHAGGARAPRFDSPAGFYKWLEAIALARLKDQQRALRRQKRDVAREARPPANLSDSAHDIFRSIAGDQSTPSRHVAKQEAIAAVMSSLARLSDDQRAVIRLRFLESRPVAEVAQRLGKSEPAIHMLCHRGLKALRQRLGAITEYLTRS